MAAPAHETINNEKGPPLNNKRKENETKKRDHSKPPEMDYLTEKEKQQEATYLKQMAEDDSPWTARTRLFLNTKETDSPDLSLAKIPDLSSDTMIVKLETSDILPVLNGWGMCLAGIFVGRFPGKEAVLTLMRRWPSKASVSYHSKGWMFFQFPTLQGLRATSEKGPFSIFGIPLHLEPVNDDFSFSKELASHLPVWIRIPDLPPLLWTKNVIEKIASTVGVPEQVDEATIKKEILDGPRVKVQINAAVKPRDCIDIMLANGQIHSQKIHYESHPKYCLKCRVFGHFGSDCLGPQTRGRQFQKKFGEHDRHQPRRDSRAPQPDPHRQGKRPPSRPPSRPPQAQNLRWRPLQQQDQPAARPASPNRFESLRDQIVDLLDKELETPKQPSRREDDPSLADLVSSSYHSSDTAVRPVETAAASPSSVHLGDEHQNDETVEDNWETHATPTLPPKGKGNAVPFSPSLSSNANSFVSERVKETNQEAENETEEEEILETPPSSPQLRSWKETAR